MKKDDLIRYGAPGELDHADKGQRCLVKKDNTIEVYEQTSSDSENPRWELIEIIKE